MRRQGALCECGHWDNRHKEEWEEITDGSFYSCTVKGCDCADFRHDAEMEKDLENEAKQLRYDIERGK